MGDLSSSFNAALGLGQVSPAAPVLPPHETEKPPTVVPPPATPSPAPLPPTQGTRVDVRA